MLQGSFNFLSSAVIEIAVFLILLIIFFIVRKDPRLVVSGMRLVRTMILLLIFFYFMFVWVSAINPTLRAISIFGMFIMNLFMIYNLILARLERPYRDALAAITQEPDRHELIHNVWHTGKRFHYLHYVWSSLFSGANPFHFLHDVATDRVRDDIKDTLRRYGVEQKMITVPMMAGYLKSQIACDTTMPVDFKDVMVKAIDDFANHPWIQEQGNEFLHLATVRPEDLHFPEWMDKFEACVRTYKSKTPD
jgi:Ca2+/Na+ antiporter